LENAQLQDKDGAGRILLRWIVMLGGGGNGSGPCPMASNAEHVIKLYSLTAWPWE